MITIREYARKKYNLEYVPTAMYFEFGKPINKLIGTDDVKEIQNFQKRHLD